MIGQAHNRILTRNLTQLATQAKIPIAKTVSNATLSIVGL